MSTGIVDGQAVNAAVTNGAFLSATQGSEGFPILVSAVGGVSFSAPQERNQYFIAGNGGPVTITANPQITAGQTVCQVVTFIGQDDVDTVTFSDGNGLSLSQATVTLGLNDTLTLMWTSSMWVQVPAFPATVPAASANYVYAGPTGGGSATPAFRALIAADLPNTAVTPGSYTNANITVSAKGLVTAASSGTAPVTAVSVASANGFAGSSSGGATPALTLSTSITGVLKGNGTAISAAASGTDYQTPISTNAGASHQFVTAFTAPNTFTLAQPAFTDISGTATVAQTTVGTQALGTLTTTGTVNWANGSVFTATLTSGSACTFTFSNKTSGQTVVVVLTNGSAGGTATVVWPTVKWAGGSVPVMSTGTAAIDVYTFIFDNVNVYGSVVKGVS